MTPVWSITISLWNPPWVKLPHVTEKIRREGTVRILIAMYWPRAPWFSAFNGMVDAVVTGGRGSSLVEAV